MSDTGAKTAATIEAEAWSGSFTAALINTSNDQRAIHFGDVYAEAQISDFTFGLPLDATIDGILVSAEFSCDSGSKTAYIRLSLSYNDGVNWTATKEDSVYGSTDTVKNYGGTADTWGRTWSTAEFANGAFQVKVEGKTDVNYQNCRLDYLYVTVYFTSTAGCFLAFF